VSSHQFQWPLRVYIEDTDAGGIVYYVNYLKFMERARTEYMRSLGFGKLAIFNQQLMFVVHSVNAKYLKPAMLDDQLSATVRLLKAGAVRLQMEQLILRDGELLCKGEVEVACVDKDTMKPRRLPPEILGLLNT
jgi:tol-pal system-associated acyl-CoA thioesterase